MSEAIRVCKRLVEELSKKFDALVPEVVVNEQLQKKQFREYKFWFDANGYLFYNLPTIDFSVPIFEKIVEIAKRFESSRILEEYTSSNNERGIEFNVYELNAHKRRRIVLLHDRFLIGRNAITPPQPFIEKLADALLKLYVKYGDRKKKTPKLGR